MPLIELRDVVKNYGGLRPFRLRALSVEPGEVVVIEGPDRQAAAVLTDLLTGTTLPEAGSVVIDGTPTSSITEQDDWLRFLDRFGIVNDRVVLLDALSLAANLAVPLTLDLDPMAAAVRGAVERLAAEVGLEAGTLDQPLHEASPLSRLFVRLGRAIAHDPAILLLEHPTADIEDREVASASETLYRVARGRQLAVVLVSADRRMPRGGAKRSLSWHAGTGEVVEGRAWRRWFS